MEFLIEKTTSLALMGYPFDMKWNLFKTFSGNHQTRNHQSGKVDLSVMKTKTILLQNNTTHPIPHHLDSSHQSSGPALHTVVKWAPSLLCTLFQAGDLVWRVDSSGGGVGWGCTGGTAPGGTVGLHSTLRNWACSSSCECCVCGNGCPGRKHDHCKEYTCKTAGTQLSCICLLLHFCSLREQLRTAFVRPGLPNDTLGKSTGPSQPVAHPIFRIP